MTRSPAIAGAEVSSYSPRRVILAIPRVRSICPPLPKSIARRARHRIESEEARIDRRQENAPTAGLTLGSADIGPERHATVDETLGIWPMQVDFRIKAPFLSTPLRVERDDTIEWRRQIHHAICDNRRRLELAFAAVTATVGNIPGVVFPDELQLRDIAAIDLAQRRVAAATWSPA